MQYSLIIFLLLPQFLPDSPYLTIHILQVFCFFFPSQMKNKTQERNKNWKSKQINKGRKEKDRMKENQYHKKNAKTKQTDTMEPIFCLPTFSRHVACSGVEMILTVTFHWKQDWYFFSQKTPTVNSFLNRVGPLCSLPFLSLLGFCQFWTCVCFHSLLKFICGSVLLLERLFPLSYPPLLAVILSGSSSSLISNLWDRRFDNLLFNTLRLKIQFITIIPCSNINYKRNKAKPPIFVAYVNVRT